MMIYNLSHLDFVSIQTSVEAWRIIICLSCKQTRILRYIEYSVNFYLGENRDEVYDS